MVHDLDICFVRDNGFQLGCLHSLTRAGLFPVYLTWGCLHISTQSLFYCTAKAHALCLSTLVRIFSPVSALGGWYCMYYCIPSFVVGAHLSVSVQLASSIPEQGPFISFATTSGAWGHRQLWCCHLLPRFQNCCHFLLCVPPLFLECK